MVNVRDMSFVDQAIVRAMIVEAARQLGFDYEVRLGVSREESSNVITNWPPADETELVTKLTINNSMNEMCHAIRFRNGWPEHLPCTRQEARDVFAMWLGHDRWDDA
jgi:hypothetical protein